MKSEEADFEEKVTQRMMEIHELNQISEELPENEFDKEQFIENWTRS